MGLIDKNNITRLARQKGSSSLSGADERRIALSAFGCIQNAKHGPAEVWYGAVSGSGENVRYHSFPPRSGQVKIPPERSCRLRPHSVPHIASGGYQKRMFEDALFRSVRQYPSCPRRLFLAPASHDR